MQAYVEQALAEQDLHLIAENGRMRDMVYFSILDSEWPDVRSRLQSRLERRVG